MTTIEPRRRNTVRDRPKATDGQLECVRCQRHMRKAAVTWPDGKVCNSCFYKATSLFGSCPSCGMERMLPGRLDIGDQPVCRDCARIRQDYHCRSCGQEARPYRRGICARCTLRADLEHDLIRDDTPSEVAALIDALCSADRPESVLTWKRSAKVQPLLSAVASGATAPTHEGLDAYEPTGRHVEHLRSILIHHKALPPRDKYIAYFTRWLEDKSPQWRTTRSSVQYDSSQPGITCAGSTNLLSPASRREDLCTLPSRKSLRHFGFSRGLMPSMAAQSRRASNKTSTNGLRQARPHATQSERS